MAYIPISLIKRKERMRRECEAVEAKRRRSASCFSFVDSTGLLLRNEMNLPILFNSVPGTKEAKELDVDIDNRVQVTLTWSTTKGLEDE